MKLVRVKRDDASSDISGLLRNAREAFNALASIEEKFKNNTLPRVDLDEFERRDYTKKLLVLAQNIKKLFPLARSRQHELEEYNQWGKTR